MHSLSTSLDRVRLDSRLDVDRVIDGFVCGELGSTVLYVQYILLKPANIDQSDRLSGSDKKQEDLPILIRHGRGRKLIDRKKRREGAVGRVSF